MIITQYDIWIANLNPAKGAEPGKVRPVVIVQTNLLNDIHPTVIICPITSNVIPEAEILRIHLKKHQLDKPSDILVDQLRAIDKTRLIKRIGNLNRTQIQSLQQSLLALLDLEQV